MAHITLYTVLIWTFGACFFSNFTSFGMQRLYMEGMVLGDRYRWDIDNDNQTVVFKLIRGKSSKEYTFSSEDIKKEILLIDRQEIDSVLKKNLINQLSEAWKVVSSLAGVNGQSPDFRKAYHSIQVLDQMINYNQRTVYPPYGENTSQRKSSYLRSLLFGASLVGLAGSVVYWNRNSIQDSVSAAVGSLLAHDIFKVDWSEIIPKQSAAETMSEQFISFVNWVKPQQ
jgi:hypothetical protein